MPARIGDEIDDYCTRCHRLTNHTVAAMVGESIASATCRTCGFQHPYKGGAAPRRSKPSTSAFDQVLAGILAESAPPPPLDEDQKPVGKKAKKTARPKRSS